MDEYVFKKALTMSGIKNEYHYYISPTVNVWRENVPEGFTLGMHPLDITVITEDIVRWCCHHFEMEVDGINVTLHDEYKDKDCWDQSVYDELTGKGN